MKADLSKKGNMTFDSLKTNNINLYKNKREIINLYTWNKPFNRIGSFCAKVNLIFADGLQDKIQ